MNDCPCPGDFLRLLARQLIKGEWPRAPGNIVNGVNVCFWVGEKTEQTGTAGENQSAAPLHFSGRASNFWVNWGVGEKV